MWRFVQISDPHLGSDTDGQWNNRFLCTMMPDVIGCLRKDLAQLQPEFILATGDVASKQTRDAVFAARDLMDSLGFPYYPMGGNHDFVVAESRDWFIDAFQAHLPVSDTVYSFTHKNLHFCVLDPWWQWSDGTLCPFSEGCIAAKLDKDLVGAAWAVPPHQLAWLEYDLEYRRRVPTIIATHYPVLPIPERLQQPGLRDAGHLSNGGILLDLLDRFPQVKAVMSGHLHMHVIERVNNLTQVVTGALPEYPTEYRDLHVYEDRIEVFTCALSNTSFAQRSLIPGKEWAAGQDCDRTAVIPLI
jgi:3',5'-cyclic AMP phosphodiesterase CpdA